MLPAVQPQDTAVEQEGGEPKTLEEALTELQRLRAEKERLEQERDRLLPPLPRHLFQGRTAINQILGRKDQGEGLLSDDALITVAGWIRTTRLQAKRTLAFIHLNDGSCIHDLQLVVDKSKTPASFEELLQHNHSTTGSSIWARGRLVKSPAKGQRVELVVEQFGVVGACPAESYPLMAQATSREYLRQVAHLRARTRIVSATMRIRSALAFAVHKFFQERGFFHVQTPLLTASDCEGAGEMFQVTTLLPKSHKLSDIPTSKTSTTQGEADKEKEKKDEACVDYAADFFARPTFLTVSGQLQAEHYACSLGSVYTFGPCFRAEHANTTRHLAEFWMIEPEVAFADLHDVIDLTEAFIKFAISHVMETCADDLVYLESKQLQEIQEQGRQRPLPPLRQRLQRALESPFQRITYTKAVEELLLHYKEKGEDLFTLPVQWGMDLASEHERYLTEVIYEGCPVVVTDYPKDIKAFYMRRNDDGETVAAMDVLVPRIGELVGGSQREERLDVLLERIRSTPGLEEEAYAAYLDLRRFGTVPHSGFGIGFERLVMFVAGTDNIRDVIPFPRYHRHCEF
ncbi:asparagine--tRNA ligase [Balamuthia mandrillaris]